MPPPQPSAAAATTAAAGPPLRARLFPQVCGGMVAALAQTLVVLRTHQGRSAAEFALALMPAAVLFVPLVLVPVLVPRLWVKHGAAVAVATRLAFFEVLKIPGSGGANKLLQVGVQTSMAGCAPTHLAAHPSPVPDACSVRCLCRASLQPAEGCLASSRTCSC